MKRFETGLPDGHRRHAADLDEIRSGRLATHPGFWWRARRSARPHDGPDDGALSGTARCGSHLPLATAESLGRDTADRPPDDGPPMPKKTEPPLELKEACLRAAREVIAERGVEQLSLREVARKLGVSHQAPYRHYPSRDHLLAEVMRRCFESFARSLDARQRHDDPGEDLASLGRQYLSYAAAHPLEYRLMFGTPWPEPAEHPDLLRDAVHAFDMLRDVLRRMHGSAPDRRARIDLDAMFIWSTIHGLASVTQANVMQWLRLAPRVDARAQDHVMRMIEAAMSAPDATKA
jgi:AcrR family transcriptional regulator